jgi:hypothetical protein
MARDYTKIKAWQKAVGRKQKAVGSRQKTEGGVKIADSR